ncbi:MAG TPA: hypothetical protein VMU47_10725 [Caldimonas sp.]|nr:hypothetical protein [Caldimonas sp.]
MHTHRIIGITIGASLIALANAANAQTWPTNDEAARPMRGSYSGAPAGEGPGTQGSQGRVLQGDGAALPDSGSSSLIVVVPPPAPASSTTVIVPAPADVTTRPSAPGTPGSTQ